jgi:hypothetical protein
VETPVAQKEHKKEPVHPLPLTTICVKENKTPKTTPLPSSEWARFFLV